ncbi:MAG TPA: ribose 5-phosphate isomerase B [Pyrinomonadaceae bacterium]|nr:ribose 5-phosphate isomerase B [Pyrinomonadaceae bacterium]
MTKKIALAADHAGYEEKEKVKATLDELGIEYVDLGTTSTDSVDYPDYAQKVGEAVSKGEVEQGLLVCGSGTGMAIAANKVKGVRAAVAWSPDIARLARQHNDANVLSLPARFMSESDAAEVIKAWFEADFEGGRHEKRVEKITELENGSC